ncbi:unnamed protein product [Miscanthus lutarioriparius]|uniref:RRM domain-containing protein n=1 Tax=Miscanthus lutarioriparius TaxID=422564 RepID=A0A811NJ93_9POAL|nr:unnamed protein product [Miscanthus lutarioriparius]
MYAGLNKRTTSDGLKEAFSKFGQVVEARVITDRISGYSRGFGFVKYATVQEAGEAIKGMDGKVTAFFDHCVAKRFTLRKCNAVYACAVSFSSAVYK